MGMDGNKLGQEIADAITHSEAPDEAKAEVLKLWQKVGNAIVNHIQKNARVQPGINVDTIVNTNVATPAGPGTGTGSGSGATTDEGKIQ